MERTSLEEEIAFAYQYDANGNQTQKTDKVTGDFTTYEYDAENKLIRVVSSSGTTANYKYDGLGRRIEKEVTEAGLTNITRYIYDNEDILLELDTQNSILARYTHGPGIDEPLVMEKGGASFFYHADGLGSITEITNASGTVVQAYTYSSFGKIESQLDPNFIQPYTFTAREFDPETGLYFYRARFYDGSSGRFFQMDPIGLAGGINLYAYVEDNPINFVDPFGLIGLKEIVQNPKVQAIGGAAIGFLLEKLSGKLCPGIGRGLVSLAGFAIAVKASASAAALSIGFGTVAVVSSPTVIGTVVNGAAALGFGALAIQQGVTASNFLEQAIEDFRSSGRDCDLVCSGASTN